MKNGVSGRDPALRGSFSGSRSIADNLKPYTYHFPQTPNTKHKTPKILRLTPKTEHRTLSQTNHPISHAR
jgi:hypothetical protein